MFPNALHRVPRLLVNDGLMGVLHQHLFLRRTVEYLLVLVGQGTALHIQCVTQVHRVGEDVRHRCAAPVIRACGIQPCAGYAGLLVVLVSGVQHMVVPQYAGDLIRPFPLSTELEDALDDTLCLLVGYESLAVIVPLAVAVGRLAA